MGLVAKVVNRSPVAFASAFQSSPLGIFAQRGDHEAMLSAYGQNGTLFAIVDALMEGTAQAEWKLWRRPRTPDGERTEVTRHAALDTWNRPNPFYTRQELVASGQQHRDLTGETWLVIGRDERSSTPLELWCVRPDRMQPVKHPELFISGYVYTGPNGEKVPLGLDEVLFLRRPNPLDPWRGAGPVQALLMDLDSARYSAEWNRNFFLNSAEPGGVVEADHEVDDDEFRRLTARWRESHQGVARAHRVAVLEQGLKWIERKFSMRDMQFAELRGVSREIIREAYRFPKPMLGTVEDVNRANADAAEVVFGRWLVRPRLEAWKQMLNTEYLPLFGPTSLDLEFDFCLEIPEDMAALAAELTAKVNAASTLISTGFDPADTLLKLGLPEIDRVEVVPVPDPVPPGLTDRLIEVVRNVSRKPALPDADQPDLGGVAEDWQIALDALVKDWGPVRDRWYGSLVDQIRRAIGDGDVGALAALAVPASQVTDLAEIVTGAMVDLAGAAGGRVAEEAGAQGVKLDPVRPERRDLAEVAATLAALLAVGLAVSAGTEALRARGPTSTAGEVADTVRTFLDGLTDAQPVQMFGGALTGAQNRGRIETMKAGPEGAVYASEVLDSNTCGPCRAVHGRWLGNTGDLDMIEATYPGGAYGGYVDCEGRSRCRGTVVGVWRAGSEEA